MTALLRANPPAMTGFVKDIGHRQVYASHRQLLASACGLRVSGRCAPLP
jgi:hypothetical protein